MKMSGSLQEEIIDISKTLTHLHDRLGELAKRITEDEQETLRQLEDDNGRLRDGIEELKIVNAKLQQAGAQPELDKAMEARDGALRKLRHARKVIKDLVEEREMEEANRSRTVSPAPSAVSMGSLKDILSSRSSLTSSSNSSVDSGRTVRGGNRGRTVEPQKAVSPTTLSINGFSARLREDRRADLSACPTPSLTDLARSRTMSPMHSPTMSAPGSPTPSSQTDSEQMMMIYFSRPPRTANLYRGPYNWHELKHKFSLDNATLGKLKRLKSDQELQMRILTLGDVAFVYDPIFAESGQTSLLLDWGDKDLNEMIINHITEQGKVYQTFVFPSDKNKWYYLGALTWKPVVWEPIWPSLRPKAQAEIMRRLKKRSGAAEGVEERVTSGEAEQITFEISGHGHDQLSQAYATRLESSTRV